MRDCSVKRLAPAQKDWQKYICTICTFLRLCMIACTRKMPTSIPEDGPQLSAEGNFHQHINVFLVLERLVQPEKESFRRGKQKNSIIWWTLDISPCWKVWGVWVISCFENDVDWEGFKRLPRRFKLNLVSTATLSSLQILNSSICFSHLVIKHLLVPYQVLFLCHTGVEK